jgi:hypothetical protein
MPELPVNATENVLPDSLQYNATLLNDELLFIIKPMSTLASADPEFIIVSGSRRAVAVVSNWAIFGLVNDIRYPDITNIYRQKEKGQKAPFALFSVVKPYQLQLQ